MSSGVLRSVSQCCSKWSAVSACARKVKLSQFVGYRAVQTARDTPMLSDFALRACILVAPPLFVLGVYFLKQQARRRCSNQSIKWDPQERAWKVTALHDINVLIKRPEVRANYMPSLMQGIESKNRAHFEFLQNFFLRWPLFQDGSEQRRTHRVLAAQFTAAKMQDRIAAVINTVSSEIIASNIANEGTWDLVGCYAKPFPLRVIIDVLGFDRDDENRLKAWADIIENWFGGRGDALERFTSCQQALSEFWARAEQLVQKPPVEGSVASELMKAEERGELQAAEVIPNLFFLMAAGHETTSSFISNSLHIILQDAALERRLRQCVNAPDFTVDSMEYDAIIEELLRFTSPVKCMYREVCQDFEYKGVSFSTGEQIHLLNSGANFDPSVFPEPSRILPGRNNVRKHITFGVHDHICPGMRLGRLMGKVALSSLLRRMPNLRLAVAPEQVNHLPLDSISALETLPVVHSEEK